MCKKEICCLEITIAARIVGMVGLIISGIVMSQLISELVHHDGRGKITTLLGIDIDEFVTDEDTKGRAEPNYFIIICCLFSLAQVIANALLIWGTIVAVSIVVMTILTMELNGEEKGRGKIAILLGIDIDEFDINHKQCDSNAVANTTNYKYESSNSVYFFVLSCYIYSLMEIVANALLVWGTLVEKLWYAVPWFMCKSINLSIQFIGFIYYIMMDDEPENQILTTALFNFVITLSFWCTVYQMVQRWMRQDSPDISYTRIMVEEDNPHQADPSQMAQTI